MHNNDDDDDDDDDNINLMPLNGKLCAKTDSTFYKLYYCGRRKVIIAVV